MAELGFIPGALGLEVWRVDDNGYMKGQNTTPNSVSGPTLLTPYRITHLDSVTQPAPTRERATDRGGQKIRGQVDLGVSDFGTFDMVLTDYDMTFDALISGAVVDSTYVTGMVQSAPNFNNGSLPVCGLALYGYWQDRKPGATYGSLQKLTICYPRCQIAPAQPGLNQSGGTNPNSLTYTITPTTTGYLPNGIPFSFLANEYTDDINIVHNMKGLYEYGFCGWVADGSAVTFTLPYLPVYSTVTNGTLNNWVTKNGQSVAPTSISITTGVVTIAAAGNAGDIWEVIYPTNRATA